VQNNEGIFENPKELHLNQLPLIDNYDITADTKEFKGVDI
jgi:hypothetical protein